MRVYVNYPLPDAKRISTIYDWDNKLSLKQNMDHLALSIAENCGKLTAPQPPMILDEAIRDNLRDPEDVFFEVWKKAAQDYRASLTINFEDMADMAIQSVWDMLSRIDAQRAKANKSEFRYKQAITDFLDELVVQDYAKTIESFAFQKTVLEPLKDQVDLSTLESLGSLCVIYYPALAAKGTHHWQDQMVECDASTGVSTLVIPDSHLQNFLQYAGYSEQEYLAIIAQSLNIDIPNELYYPANKDAPFWEDLTAAYANVDRENIAEKWFDRVAGTDIPSDSANNKLVSPSELLEIIDNCNGYGLAAHAFFISCQDLVDAIYAETLCVTGGQFGIHDPINGSGHTVTVTEPVNINIDNFLNGVIYDGEENELGVGLNMVFGYLGDEYDAKVETRKEDEDLLSPYAYDPRIQLNTSL